MKSLFIKSRKAKIGAAPGALIHVGEQVADKTSLRIMTYDGAGLDESSPSEVPDILSPPEKGVCGSTWTACAGWR